MTDFILAKYEQFKSKIFEKLKFTYSEFLLSLENLDKTIFQIELLGKSFEDRDIFLIKAGKGKTKIVLWSQMHGNEPISTQGLIDFLLYLQSPYVEKKIFDKFTFYAIPLLNPDGAEKFQRRNAQNIDLNRDALKLTTPEAKLLFDLIIKTQPNFAFNLHDQERYYGSSNSDLPTALSLLTPSFDYEKNIDEPRKISMQLVASIYQQMIKYLPNSIAKYNDTFMPTAFGDNVQKLQISTILLEAGYILNDQQRQKSRKYYFLAVLCAINSIYKEDFKQISIEIYNKIPQNIKLNFVDFKLKNITIIQNGKEFATDISIVRNILDSEKFTDLTEDYIIWDIGDLRTVKAFVEKDCAAIKITKTVERLENADFLLSFTNLK